MKGTSGLRETQTQGFVQNRTDGLFVTTRRAGRASVLGPSVLNRCFNISK